MAKRCQESQEKHLGDPVFMIWIQFMNPCSEAWTWRVSNQIHMWLCLKMMHILKYNFNDEYWISRVLHWSKPTWSCKCCTFRIELLYFYLPWDIAWPQFLNLCEFVFFLLSPAQQSSRFLCCCWLSVLYFSGPNWCLVSWTDWLPALTRDN